MIRHAIAAATLAAATLTVGTAHADTVITGEGIFMPRGTTAKQFRGELCAVHTCVTTGSVPTNVNAQARRIQAAVAQAQGPIIVHGYSLTAASVERSKLEWLRHPETAPSPDMLRIITTGSPYNRYGGTQRNTKAAQAAAVPGPIHYEQLDVVAQYGSVEDRPTRFGWYSAIEVSLARHQTGYNVDINDPGNLINADGTYMLLPATELRQLRGVRFLRDIGLVSEERYDEIDRERRELIEADYDRPELHQQGPGADWAKGVKPERLREESSQQSTSDDTEPTPSRTTSRSTTSRATTHTATSSPEPDTSDTSASQDDTKPATNNTPKSDSDRSDGSDD